METGLVLRLVPALVVGGVVGWLAGLLIGLGADSARATIVLRTLLTAAMLLFLTRILVRRAYARPALARSILLAAVASYALSPPAWVGRALLGQLVLEAGPATIAVDLVLWTAVVALAGRSVEPRPAPAPRQPYQAS